MPNLMLNAMGMLLAQFDENKKNKKHIVSIQLGAMPVVHILIN
jgi:hypothetical protein